MKKLVLGLTTVGVLLAAACGGKDGSADDASERAPVSGTDTQGRGAAGEGETRGGGGHGDANGRSGHGDGNGAGAGQGGSGPAPGVGCEVDSDCGATESCAFELSLACKARGTCIADPSKQPGVATCASVEIACGCDGERIGIPCFFPQGYAPFAVAHTGDCHPAATTCKTDGDCPSTETCAYQIADACRAEGACIADPSKRPGTATCASVELACGCGGQKVGVPCFYPQGYAPAPIAGFGACP